ncbi:acetylcholine-gated chloride channel subunit acc-3-like isoform X2 [Tigriopus californicus]|uniref:acetylcholine-gated chloride channel subunit acc-3-like isoform X2 n=1 Tax=Tigriopus californicus TaxID=6832 RepID=UPI0027DA028E|nr:acetylcholine-gated chloride channel subunit acc-3-like isoform X2 [Tigriopus californicus]
MKLYLMILIFLSAHGCTSSFFFELPNDYNKNEPDTFPALVELDFTIVEIIDVDDIQNAISLQGGLTMTWLDSRVRLNLTNPSLNLKESNLNPEEKSKFWTPDVWIANLRDFKLIKSYEDQATFTITKDKKLQLWQSVTIKTSCPMYFEFYPFDIQTCTLKFSANGLDYNAQRFIGNISFREPLHLSQGALQFHNIRLEQDAQTSFKSKETNRVWPQLQVTFFMERRRVDHILQTFQPTGCVVCLSWISFLIPPYIVPGRMVLLVTLLLVVFSTYQTEHQRSPRSSSLKALDVWFMGCMVFVLAAICEYAVQLLLKRLIIRKRRQQDKEEREIEETMSKVKVTFVKDLFLNSLKTSANDRELEEEVGGNTVIGKSSVPARSSAVTPRYRSATATTRHIKVSPLENNGNKVRPLKQKPPETVMDSGSEYGDINDSELEGEELLEKIDDTALKVFPCCFMIFNIAYWANYTLRENLVQNA